MTLLPALLDSVRPGRAHLLPPDPFSRLIPALTSALAFSPGPCVTLPFVLEALDSSCPRCNSPFILSSPLPHSPMALSAFNALFHSYRVQSVASTTTPPSPSGYRLTCPDPARLPFPSMPVVLDLPHPSLGTYPAYFLTPWGEWIRLCPRFHLQLLTPLPTRRLRRLLLAKVFAGQDHPSLPSGLTLSLLTPLPMWLRPAEALYTRCSPSSLSLALLRSLLSPAYATHAFLSVPDPSATPCRLSWPPLPA